MTPFLKTSVLCTALALALAACGGGDDNRSNTPDNPPGGPGGPSVPTEVISDPVTFTPSPDTEQGSSDASTAIPLSGGWMLVGDDETNTLRVYPRAGGEAALEWSYETDGPKFEDELDLEGGASVDTATGKTVYLIGSHSNKKDGEDAEADRSHLFAVKVAGTGAATTFDYVGQFASLESQLVAWDTGNAHGLGASHFGFAPSAGDGIAPERVDGFSIEGLTTSADDSELWLGFRAPLTDTVSRTKALIVPVTNYAALVDGTAATAAFGKPIELDLGGRGIRSLDKGTDGNYLIIAGPPGASQPEIDQNFALFSWNGDVKTKPVELDNDLEDRRKKSNGSFETIVGVEGDAAAGSGTTVQLLMDNGDTIFEGKTIISKDLPEAEQRFLGVSLELRGPRVDTSGPVLKKSNPSDGREGINVDSDITLAFNEGIVRGAGSVQLHKADGTVVETFAPASSRARINFNTLTLNPTANLEYSKGYYVTIAADAVLDHQGNAYAGINDATTLDFTAAGTPTPLAIGDILFMGANVEPPDAFAFVTLKALNGGTQITFTDRDRDPVEEFAGITNETVFIWTADRNLPAGTIVTIQTDVDGSPIANKGFTIGSPGGLGKEETIFAYVGGTVASLIDGNAGEITSVGDYLASITLGGPDAGVVPPQLVTAGTAFSFTIPEPSQTNAIYKGSLDRSNLTTFAARVKDTATNWTSNQNATGVALTNGSMFAGE